MRSIFSPSTSYQVLDFVEEEIEVMVTQMIVEKKTNSPSEDIQQFTETKTPNKM